jgi:hypothetical protein
MSAAEATIENMAMIAALKRWATQIGYDDDFFLNLPGFGCQAPGLKPWIQGSATSDRRI